MKKLNTAVIIPLLGLCLLFGMNNRSHAQVPQIPQIPAFLPMMTDFPATAPLPIAGEWMIDTIRKRIRIDRGRAYVIDPWVHMFVLKVNPLMVVLSEIRRTGAGQFTGQDLPLVGQFTASLAPDGMLHVSVAGVLGPVNYILIPVSITDQHAFALEKACSVSVDDCGDGLGDSQPPASAPEQPVSGEPSVDPDQGEPPVSPW